MKPSSQSPHLERSKFVNQDVGWLEIAIENAVGMQILQSCDQFVAKCLEIK